MNSLLHAVLCAAGYNLRWLMRAVVRLGLKVVFLRLLVLWRIWLLGQSRFGQLNWGAKLVVSA